MIRETEQTEVAVDVEIDADTCLEAAAGMLAGPQHPPSSLYVPGPFHCK